MWHLAANSIWEEMHLALCFPYRTWRQSGVYPDAIQARNPCAFQGLSSLSSAPHDKGRGAELFNAKNKLDRGQGGRKRPQMNWKNTTVDLTSSCCPFKKKASLSVWCRLLLFVFNPSVTRSPSAIRGRKTWHQINTIWKEIKNTRITW